MANSLLLAKPGSVVVFEGLDKAGKSTQLARLQTQMKPSSTFVHMPSGFSAFSARVYNALETEKPKSEIARQLAHLSCHADNIDAIVSAAVNGGVVLDRWWWSTVAYGWYGGNLQSTGWTEDEFNALIQNIWHPVTATVVFLFLEPHAPDENNVPRVDVGYLELAALFPDQTVEVPSLNEESTSSFIASELVDRGIASRE